LRKLDYLKNKKNLLAFSGGVDSSALFFMLLEKNISFDLIMVNYNLREQSLLEVEYAKELALKYNKTLFLKEIDFNIHSGMEEKARKIRYSYFNDISSEFSYENVILAHHLNDRMEWFLMQMSKGAGFEELLGFNDINIKPNYTIVRPLLATTRNEIEEYLESKSIVFFQDESNSDEKYKRNFMRHNFSNKFIDEFGIGVQKTFDYLDNDKKRIPSSDVVKIANNLFRLNKIDIITDVKGIDIILKKEFNYLISHSIRNEIVKQSFNISIANKYIISSDNNYIYVSLDIRKIIPKNVKERYRKLKIPVLLRPFLFSKGLEEQYLMNLN
jgi:tRNA(Ile)-lysidine synthase